MIILGIESSCDETAAAIVEDGKKVLSSFVSSQISVHKKYGGVVPELASRKHIEAIVPVVEEAIRLSGVRLDGIDAVAVTRGPGLIGSLLVGFSFAKSFAYARNIPWIGVNHLEGHISSVFLEDNSPEFPFIALLVSGGHTSIYFVTSHTDFELLGQTRDDAVGEAYDKVAKMLDLGYPGGCVIDLLAKQGKKGTVVFPKPFLDKTSFDFSFSGLKTAVSRYIQEHPDSRENRKADIVRGFQESVVDVLSYKVMRAAREKGCKCIAVVGGVAANSRLREKIEKQSKKEGFSIHIPAIKYCGDNAAMISAIGFHYIKKGITSTADEDVFSRSWVSSGKHK